MLSITSMGTSPYPVMPLHKYSSMIPKEQQTGALFSAGKFIPLTRPQLSTIVRCLLKQAGYNSELYKGAAITSAVAACLLGLLILRQWIGEEVMPTYLASKPHQH